jgi:hypothetical protein
VSRDSSVYRTCSLCTLYVTYGYKDSVVSDCTVFSVIIYASLPFKSYANGIRKDQILTCK